MNDFAIALALHVLGIVVWIGGVSMVTMVVLPAIRHRDLGDDQLQSFQAVERRFVWQARSAIVLVGATGFYMCWRLNLWGSFRNISFWWMHAMVAVWLLFALLLFIIEPLFLHRYLHAWLRDHPAATFMWLRRMHWLLLALSGVTILGAVAGSHGGSLF